MLSTHVQNSSHQPCRHLFVPTHQISQLKSPHIFQASTVQEATLFSMLFSETSGGVA